MLKCSKPQNIFLFDSWDSSYSLWEIISLLKAIKYTDERNATTGMLLLRAASTWSWFKFISSEKWLKALRRWVSRPTVAFRCYRTQIWIILGVFQAAVVSSATHEGFHGSFYVFDATCIDQRINHWVEVRQHNAKIENTFVEVTIPSNSKNVETRCHGQPADEEADDD